LPVLIFSNQLESAGGQLIYEELALIYLVATYSTWYLASNSWWPIFSPGIQPNQAVGNGT
jgi:hypothetical protein